MEALFFLHWRSHTIGLALELYHMPRGFLNFIVCMFPHPTLIRGTRVESLRPRARQRAAELRVLAAQYYIVDALGGEASRQRQRV